MSVAVTVRCPFRSSLRLLPAFRGRAIEAAPAGGLLRNTDQGLIATRRLGRMEAPTIVARTRTSEIPRRAGWPEKPFIEIAKSYLEQSQQKCRAATVLPRERKRIGSDRITVSSASVESTTYVQSSLVGVAGNG